MFGIGGGEMIFIIFVALMLFGTDRIPEFARALGKGMAQLKNATNEIKSEIHKSAEANGLDTRSLTGGLVDEIESVKGSFRKIAETNPVAGEFDEISRNFQKLTEHNAGHTLDIKEISSDITAEISKAKANIDDIVTGPIKRQN